MPSTYLSLHYHIVFSTKSRKRLIVPDWRQRLHEFLGGTVRGLGGVPEQIGGTDDHAHLLLGLKATHCLADFMREVKKSSSGWVHNEMKEDEFAWQEGYSGFTVSPTARHAVRRYILNQEAHHHKKTFREELIELLELSGVQYDPKYLD